MLTTQFQANGAIDPICDRQRALAAFLFLALCAWVSTFTVSVFRYMRFALRLTGRRLILSLGSSNASHPPDRSVYGSCLPSVSFCSFFLALTYYCPPFTELFFFLSFLCDINRGWA